METRDAFQIGLFHADSFWRTRRDICICQNLAHQSDGDHRFDTGRLSAPAYHCFYEEGAAALRSRRRVCRLDRLSIKKFNKSELKAIYWILSSLIARPVAQSFDGTLLYDVIDTGKKKGPKVRADLTSAELDFHTDYSYNRPPRYFGLQTLRTAKRGGRNGAVSLMMTAHNEMRKRYPDLLKRLYQPFWINRYNEHAPGEPRASFHSIYAYDGNELWARFNPRNIYAGYDIAGQELDLGRPRSDRSIAFDSGRTAYAHKFRPCCWSNSLFPKRLLRASQDCLRRLRRIRPAPPYDPNFPS